LTGIKTQRKRKGERRKWREIERQSDEVLAVEYNVAIARLHAIA